MVCNTLYESFMLWLMAPLRLALKLLKCSRSSYWAMWAPTAKTLPKSLGFPRVAISAQRMMVNSFIVLITSAKERHRHTEFVPLS
jgi:hypothetical protein